MSRKRQCDRTVYRDKHENNKPALGDHLSVPKKHVLGWELASSPYNSDGRNNAQYTAGRLKKDSDSHNSVDLPE